MIELQMYLHVHQFRICGTEVQREIILTGIQRIIITNNHCMSSALVPQVSKGGACNSVGVLSYGTDKFISNSNEESIVEVKV